jgi:hypothetical protein
MVHTKNTYYQLAYAQLQVIRMHPVASSRHVVPEGIFPLL